MIVVRVEVWPDGKREGSYEIGRMVVGDITKESPPSEAGTGDVYAAHFRGQGKLHRVPRLLHRREQGFWRLIMSVLESALYTKP